MEYEEFRDSVKKVSGTRKHSINNSIGAYDIYKLIRKDKWKGIGKPVTEKLFYQITGRMNELLAQLLIEGKEVILPCRMGSLEIKKKLPKVKIVNGQLRTNLPIDWNATLKLWYEDEEAKRDKILVRSELKQIFRIVYSRKSANYENKVFYQFRPIRRIKQQLSTLANEDKLDAYLLRND